MAWNQEWLNQNAGRAYPFKEDSPVTDTTGSVRIPTSMIVDMCMVVPEKFMDTFYLRELAYAGNSLILTLASNSEDIAVIAANLATHVTNQAYNIVGIGDFTDIRGRMVLGDLASLGIQLPQGTFIFTAANTGFEIRAVRPDLRTVRSLRIVKADGTVSQDLYGIVQLIEGANIRLTYVPGTVSGIRIDSLATELEEDCICNAAQVKPRTITSINGVYADTNGDITLLSTEECLSLIPGTAKLTLKDRCSSPCCGCAELTFLTTEMSKLSTSVANLEATASKLESNETNFYNNVLGTLV